MGFCPSAVRPYRRRLAWSVDFVARYETGVVVVGRYFWGDRLLAERAAVNYVLFVCLLACLFFLCFFSGRSVLCALLRASAHTHKHARARVPLHTPPPHTHTHTYTHTYTHALTLEKLRWRRTTTMMRATPKTTTKMTRKIMTTISSYATTTMTGLRQQCLQLQRR